MRSAAVGFQCPDCVKSGSRETRSGRTAYGGQRSANPALTSQVLIVLNVAVWIAIVATGSRSSDLINRLALIPGGRCEGAGGVYYPGIGESRCVGSNVTWVDGVASGAPWQLVTSMFTHVDVWHIGFNMLALWFLGPQLEAAIGRGRYLALYFGSGLAGSALVYLAADQDSSTLGASGAIFGLMAGLLVIAFKVRGDVQSIMVWIGLNAAITVVGRGFISWQGHLGGFLGGLALMVIIAYAPRERRTWWQLAGFALVGIVVFGTIAARSVQLA